MKNPELQKEINDLQQMINKGVNSKRFIKTPCCSGAGYKITDTKTNKSCHVPLFALSSVMDVLVDLFE